MCASSPHPCRTKNRQVGSRLELDRLAHRSACPGRFLSCFRSVNSIAKADSSWRCWLLPHRCVCAQSGPSNGPRLLLLKLTAQARRECEIVIELEERQMEAKHRIGKRREGFGHFGSARKKSRSRISPLPTERELAPSAAPLAKFEQGARADFLRNPTLSRSRCPHRCGQIR